VAAVLLVLVKVPQALPEQAAPASAQVTPWFWLSLDTVAVKASVCPWSSAGWAEEERETATGGVLLLLWLPPPPPPPPQAHQNNETDKTNITRFMADSLVKVCKTT
jgi:hypothetical protein